MYDVVGTYYNYEDIFKDINPEDKDGFSDKCISLIQTNLNDTSVFFSDKDCTKYMKYLKGLNMKGLIYKISYGCIYLYYKIYLDMFKNKTISYTPQKFYRKFLENSHDDNILGICKDYLNEIIQVTLEKMDKLIDLYKIYNNIKSNEDCNFFSQCVALYNDNLMLCRIDNDHEFCNELEKFRYTYEARVASLNCVGMPRTLESTKPFDSFVILLPFTIILITSFILFILYKVDKNFN
ncbi:hypothetical protein PVNG_04450 [Plasmodium vivax North Korean]|uniref:Variable surface protein n=1 Tax=Plasmodium vivax North Korean TaxID=1035514 RepID=A0A0J9WFD5_PLAVI|nr:hypothetical protein PVNG_04450 [Plasmodium vivax North Korean]